jgi:hypothetical protein
LCNDCLQAKWFPQYSQPQNSNVSPVAPNNYQLALQLPEHTQPAVEVLSDISSVVSVDEMSTMKVYEVQENTKEKLQKQAYFYVAVGFIGIVFFAMVYFLFDMFQVLVLFLFS